MKKLSAVLFSLILIFTNSAFVCGATPSVTYALTSNGQSEVTVKTGDQIVVTYSMLAKAKSSVYATQNEIYYDHTFFELVEGSNKVAASNFTNSLQEKIDGSRYVFYNSITQSVFPESGELVVGEFTLKVIGTTGSGAVKNTACVAFNAAGDTLNGEKKDLTVTIAGTAGEGGEGGNTGDGGNTGGAGGGGGGAGGGGGGGASAGNDAAQEPVITPAEELPTENPTPAESAGISTFKDIDANAWYYAGVKYCLENGLMKGTSSVAFSPDKTTSRAMIVTILYRMENAPAVTGTVSYSDVSSGAWYYDAVKWASDNGIVTGYANMTFAPDATVTREQMAAILYRYAGYKGKDVTAKGDIGVFSDYKTVHSYAVSAMQWAVGKNILNGTSGALRPEGGATRAQAAAIFQRFCQQ